MNLGRLKDLTTSGIQCRDFLECDGGVGIFQLSLTRYTNREKNKLKNLRSSGRSISDEVQEGLITNLFIPHQQSFSVVFVADRVMN